MLSLEQFLSGLFSNPVLAVTVILTLGVIFVNGWTDAPNAIATCVSTRPWAPGAAILMAAVFNFLGVLVMTMIAPAVAMTIYNMVDFGHDSHQALVALCAALFSIVTGRWRPGISGSPRVKATPSSPALGAAIAMAAPPASTERNG